MNKVDPIAETLKLYQNFYVEVQLKREKLALIVVNDISGDIVISLADKFVELITYALDQFGDMPCTTEDLKNLKGVSREKLIPNDITSITPGLIPMFLIKHIVKLENFKIHFQMDRNSCKNVL